MSRSRRRRSQARRPVEAAAPDQTPAPIVLDEQIEARLRAVWLLGALVGGVGVLPALAIYKAPANGGIVGLALSMIIVCLSIVPGFVSPRTRSGRVLAALVVVVAAFGLSQVTTPGQGYLLAVALGVAIGLMLPRQLVIGDVILMAVVAALIGLAYGFFGRGVAAAVAGFIFATAALAGAALSGAPALRVRFGWVVPVLATLFVLAGISIVGATTPRATWFGSLTYHGPRSSNQVAITFDDGPNPAYTLAIRDILDRYNAKATFFSVGKAVAARPDVTKALIADGQLIGNHTYNHNGLGYLDPRYGELAHGQDTIRDFAGVCPAFFRPPHGTHTPFMSRVAGRRDMHVVTWDVSAGDWATDDADLVAKRILDRVKPGSIILLHDGIDGVIGADRKVIVEALPQILDGLKLKGLEPVTLDKLLGKPGYLGSC